MSCRIIHCLSSDQGGDGGVLTLVQTWNQQAFYMLSHCLGFRAATGSRQPIAALSSEFRTAHRGTARPIPDFLCTTLSKRLGTGQWGDVSSTPLWRGLSDSTVLQIKQRERSCYFRQLQFDDFVIIELYRPSSACLPIASARCQSHIIPVQLRFHPVFSKTCR